MAQIGEEEERAKAEYKEEKEVAKRKVQHEKQWEKTRDERVGSWRDFVGKKTKKQKTGGCGHGHASLVVGGAAVGSGGCAAAGCLRDSLNR